MVKSHNSNSSSYFAFVMLMVTGFWHPLQVSVVEELGIPVKFIGVGEAVEDLQPFDAEAFVNAIFS